MERLVTSILIFLAALVVPSRAGAKTLPQGVWAVQSGYRQFATQSAAYDTGGDYLSFRDRYQLELTGQALLSGSGGADLRLLADELSSYDIGDQSVLDDLSLGRYELDAKGTVNATFLGVGYGATKSLTLMVGAPWIQAQTNVTLVQTSPNNALAVRERLGGVAFAELASGLMKAASIDASQIESAIQNDYGYENLGDWREVGLGDLQLGLSFRLPRLTRQLKMTVFSSLSLPTGRVDDPAVLHDVAFGAGYASFTNGLDVVVLLPAKWSIGTSTSVGLGLPSDAEMRVPDVGDSLLVKAERESTVERVPGHEWEASAKVGRPLWLLTGFYQQGIKRHYADQLSGGLTGNYDALERNSDKLEYYHRVGVGIDTTTAYRKNEIAIPLLLDVMWHEPITARNLHDNRYFQITLTGFVK